MEKEGECIKGSRFYRHYCIRCGAAMRVTFIKGIPGKTECEECDPGQVKIHCASWMRTPFDDDARDSVHNVEKAHEDEG